MPRANRCFLPEHTWHITHRCHKREFLLKFKRDRMNWKRWLFIAKQRFGLLSYTQCASMRELKSLHQSWHAQQDFEIRDWSGSIAIGSRNFVDHIKRQLGIGMRYRKREDCDNYFKLKETNSEY